MSFEGLATAIIPECIVDSALEELEPLLASHTRKGGSTEMVELGWSFTEAERNGTRVLARDLSDFPATQSLLAAGMKSLDEKPSQPHNLNVIVRRYRKGHGLPLHIDRHESLGDKPMT